MSNVFEDDLSALADITDIAQHAASRLPGNKDQEYLILTPDQIVPDPDQPRIDVDDDKVQDLVPSIVEHGVLQPLLVRSIDNGKYMIIAGERRWLAAKIAKKPVPVVIKDGMDEPTIRAVQLIENLKRKDLTIWETAQHIKKLADSQQPKLSQSKLAELLGMSKPTINKYLAIANAPENIQELAKNPEYKDYTLLSTLIQLHKKSADAANNLLNNPSRLTRKTVMDAYEKEKNPGNEEKKSSSKTKAAEEPEKKACYNVEFNGKTYRLLTDKRPLPGHAWLEDDKGERIEIDCSAAEISLKGQE